MEIDGTAGRWTRRSFVGMAGAAAAGAQADLWPIGILVATTYRTGSLEERLDAVKADGLAHVQLGLACVGLPDVVEALPAGLPERFGRAAAERGLTVVSVQGTFNMAHPDAEHRRAGLRGLRLLAESCAAMGTSVIHICTGTRNTESMWRRHPENGTPEAWRDMAVCVREAAAIARDARVVLSFEPEVNNIVDSARKARRLLDETGSSHLKVTMDPANLFHAGQLPRMKEVLEEAFALVGRDLAQAHAKDLDRDGDAGHKAAGEGLLDYDLYLRLLRKYEFKGPLLLHGLSRAQVAGCVGFLRRKMAGVAGGRD
ncbi:MAG TPA: sugar phosphate isomerase/epimerase family protein [Bryobacteraceae bacterium]|nr:sugar phosphate isomerase/epimerase [Bryobacterales bacterium]HRJ18303.1 sugar phosphate isomerase/epimerase family protein [Bryobacteraceae bacterium]